MCGSCIDSSYQGLCHFDMYTACEKSSLSKEVHFCSVSHTLPCIVLISISKRDPLSSDHKDKMCLYSASSAQMKMFLQSGPTWTMSKGFIKLILLLALEGIVSQIAACLNKMTAESVCGRSTDLIHTNVMGLSVLGGVCARILYLCTYACLRVCSVCNHSIKSTAITNGISWVDSRSLSLLIDFFWFPSAHQGKTFCEWPQWESLLPAGVNVL